MVEVSTLKDILSQFFKDSIPQPNFLDIDVEGHELEVLKGNDWGKFSFSYILIEQKLQSLASSANSSLTNYLEELGYKPLAHSRLSAIFKHFPQSPQSCSP